MKLECKKEYMKKMNKRLQKEAKAQVNILFVFLKYKMTLPRMPATYGGSKSLSPGSR